MTQDIYFGYMSKACPLQLIHVMRFHITPISLQWNSHETMQSQNKEPWLQYCFWAWWSCMMILCLQCWTCKSNVMILYHTSVAKVDSYMLGNKTLNQLKQQWSLYSTPNTILLASWINFFHFQWLLYFIYNNWFLWNITIHVIPCVWACTLYIIMINWPYPLCCFYNPPTPPPSKIYSGSGEDPKLAPSP